MATKQKASIRRAEPRSLSSNMPHLAVISTTNSQNTNYLTKPQHLYTQIPKSLKFLLSFHSRFGEYSNRQMVLVTILIVPNTYKRRLTFRAKALHQSLDVSL